MASLSKKIPSINVPFTDRDGRINPIWHEFLRSFVAESVTLNDDGTIDAVTVTAGNGLTLSEENVLAVGQGSGISVNSNDVSIDISNQSYVQADAEDEVLFSDISDNNAIRKTKVKNFSGIPGGLNTQVQYNDAGTFDGDSNFTTDGNGSVDIVGDLDVDNLNINGNTISSTDGNIILNPNGTGTVNFKTNMTVNGTTFNGVTSADVFTFTVPGGGSSGQFNFKTTSAGSTLAAKFESALGSCALTLHNDSDNSGSTISQSYIRLNAANVGTLWSFGMDGSSGNRDFVFGTSTITSSQVYSIDSTNRFFNVKTALIRPTTAGITASTTQTQGQRPLTTDINEVSTCANLNDTVTLPSAIAGRHCVVINNGAQTLQVFPSTGEDLGAGTDASTTITAGSKKLFISYNGTNWVSF